MSKRAAVLAIGLLLAGCGTGHGAVRTVVPDPAVPGCPAWSAPAALTAAEPLGADTVPTAARQCGRSLERVVGDGEWEVALDQRATAGLAALVSALRLPSAAQSDGACPANLVLPTVVVLEVAGTPTPIAPPTDECGRTRQEVSTAFAALTWQTVASTKIGRTRTEAAVTAGCEAFKDVLAIAASDPAPRPATTPPALLPTGTALKVCRYATSYPNGTSPAPGEVVDGVPLGGSTIGARVVASMNAVLSVAGPAATCRVAHSRFAVVLPDQGPFVAVELDGCHRLSVDGGALLQGTKGLADLLAG